MKELKLIKNCIYAQTEMKQRKTDIIPPMIITLCFSQVSAIAPPRSMWPEGSAEVMQNKKWTRDVVIESVSSILRRARRYRLQLSSACLCVSPCVPNRGCFKRFSSFLFYEKTKEPFGMTLFYYRLFETFASVLHV